MPRTQIATFGEDALFQSIHSTVSVRGMADRTTPREITTRLDSDLPDRYNERVFDRVVAPE